MKTREEVRQAVIDSLRETNIDEDLGIIDEATNPVLELGLESEIGVEVACLLSARLGIDIPNNVNPFYDVTGPGTQPKERTVGQIVDLVCRLAEKTER